MLSFFIVRRCELVVRELRRIHQEELEHRVSLEQRGVQDPARQGVPLPRFRLGLIEQDTEEYDERVSFRGSVYYIFRVFNLLLVLFLLTRPAFFFFFPASCLYDMV